MVCGRNGGTVAHIFRNPDFCDEANVRWVDDTFSNFLILCGTRDSAEDTCHKRFDRKEMGFLHCRDAKWKVIGGGPTRHGNLVELTSRPHRCALHSHLARCRRLRSLDIPNTQKIQDIEDWINKISLIPM